MKLYKVSMNGDFGDSQRKTIWAGRKTDIPKLKRELRDQSNTKVTLDSAEIEEVDFATSKDGILGLLNQHATS